MASVLIECRNCGSSNNCKNGFRGKHPLYKCLSCFRCFLLPADKKGYEASKLLAIILYGSGKASYRYLAKLFHVCPALNYELDKVICRED